MSESKMENFETRVVKLNQPGDEDLAAGIRRVSRDLPYEVKKKLNNLFSQLRLKGGMQLVLERMNGKTVGELLSEVHPMPAPIREGKIDEMEYRLYDEPKEE